MRPPSFVAQARARAVCSRGEGIRAPLLASFLAVARVLPSREYCRRARRAAACRTVWFFHVAWWREGGGPAKWCRDGALFSLRRTMKHGGKPNQDEARTLGGPTRRVGLGEPRGGGAWAGGWRGSRARNDNARFDRGSKRALVARSVAAPWGERGVT